MAQLRHNFLRRSYVCAGKNSRHASSLGLSSSPKRLFPATIFYNEGWLLRLVLDWFSRQSPTGHVLSFAPHARWFSEALLPSQFFARWRGDPRAEGWTHGDGVIGHVTIGDSALADTQLAENATQLIITEAKLFSPLSPSVRKAPYFDQAARNVACIAELLHRGRRTPDQFSSLGFLLLAPAEQISLNLFRKEMMPTSIEQKVARRASEYDSPDREQKDRWFHERFLPTLHRTNIACISWEQILEDIESTDRRFAGELGDFYADCLKFNRAEHREVDATEAEAVL